MYSRGGMGFLRNCSSLAIINAEHSNTNEGLNRKKYIQNLVKISCLRLRDYISGLKWGR